MSFPDFTGKDFKVGDRIKVEISGRTGTIVGEKQRHCGFLVRWDEPVFDCTESRVRVIHMEKEA